jgi:ADP-dependent phosphofructokinase/glucokinase
LYSVETSSRPDIPASQATIVGCDPYSVRIFTSIDAKPKMAFVGCPVEVAIVSGSAKNAR